MGNPGLQWSIWHEPATDGLCVRLRAVRADLILVNHMAIETIEDESVSGSAERYVKHSLLVQLCDELMQRGEFDQ